MSASAPNLTPPLRSALKTDDDAERIAPLCSSSSVKAVQIAEPEPEPEDPEEILRIKQFSAGVARRLSGRPPMPGESTSRLSIISSSSLEALNTAINSHLQDAQDESQPQTAPSPQQPPQRHRHRADFVTERLIAQVAEWLEHERSKTHNRKTRRVHGRRKSPPQAVAPEGEQESETQYSSKHRSYSIDSQASDVSLDRLQRIVDDSMSALGLNAIPHPSPRLGRRSRSHGRKHLSVNLNRTASSDTDWQDGDVRVPGCDGVLDNSKTLSMSGGKAGSVEDLSLVANPKERKEREAWAIFKNEIIRLTHTLRLKGWRRVPLERGDLISVERLSGALTNAVYVVSPPEHDQLMPAVGNKKPPAKLLLRIYGPQAEHIIDRENELSVLRRLARKKIGPRLLGTFKNGRFEQYLNAITLTSSNLKDHGTSKQIAKRMRELHDGIELLWDEKIGGPAVWKNWDHWLSKVEQGMTFLDSLVLSGNIGTIRGSADGWKTRGLICGVEWPKFKMMVEKYRRHLNERYGNSEVVRDQLVFAHNDTQYGNILRVRPDDEKSPLLQENYKHRQLVVIDFEYAAANTRGYEFSNHFTEWCYNYHDEKAPFKCNTHNYPKLDEQRRFLRAYVEHRPEFPHPGASTPNLTPLATPPVGPAGTPGLGATTPSSSSIVEFMLDARVPPGGWREEEKRRDEDTERQVEALLEETRLWRISNSAQWVAWGIMQSKIPGFDMETGQPVPVDAFEKETQEGDEDEADDFDYLSYAHDRVLFFWGDCVEMGLVGEQELPEALVAQLKRLKY